MGEITKIEWTDHTFNPWYGCQQVSPGCKNCYAENDVDHRFHLVQWGPHGERKRTSVSYWRQPFRWVEKANGRRARVFCASWSDWLDNQVPQQWRLDLAAVIDATPELDWLLLTKRIENYRKLAPWSQAPRNVWLGITAEDQEHYDRREPILRGIAARVHFICYEPALGPLKLGETHPDWIICGGESGPHARMMNERWARDLRDQCARAGIAFFMKQMTKKRPIPWDLMVREFPR